MTPAELYVQQKRISIAFRSQRIALEKLIGMTKDLIKFLDPDSVEDGSPCQISLHEWSNYMSKIPLRLTNHKVQQRNDIQRMDTNVLEVLARLNAQCSASFFKEPAMLGVAPPNRPNQQTSTLPALCDVDPPKRNDIHPIPEIHEQEPHHCNDLAT